MFMFLMQKHVILVKAYFKHVLISKTSASISGDSKSLFLSITFKVRKMKFGSFDERHRLKMLAIILKLDQRRERRKEGRKELPIDHRQKILYLRLSGCRQLMLDFLIFQLKDSAWCNNVLWQFGGVAILYLYS
jgi:hypothetical protein